MTKSKILSLIMAIMLMFGTFSPCLNFAFADGDVENPPAEADIAGNVGEVVGDGIPTITQFQIDYDETGTQLPLIIIEAKEGADYADIGFPESVKAQLDENEDWVSVPVKEWTQKNDNNYVPEGHVFYVPVFDNESYSMKTGIAIPYSAVSFISEDSNQPDEAIVGNNEEQLQQADLANTLLNENNDEEKLLNENVNEQKEEDKNASDNNELVNEEDDKKIIKAFYFWEENGEYKSPVDGIENVLFYLDLPANATVEKFLLPKYADAFIGENKSTERVSIVEWKKTDTEFKNLPDNSIVLEAVFSDEYRLADECSPLYGILLQKANTRGLLKASGTGDSRVYRGDRTRVTSTLFRWKKDWTYTGTSSYQVSNKFHAGDYVQIDIHYFKDSSGNKINDIYGYCLEQRWPGPNTESNTESNYGVIKEVKTLEAVYGTTNANKLRAILDHGYPVTTTINGVTWTAEEARQITQMAIRSFLADINDSAAYPALSSANINTYIEDTKNGTAMAAINWLVTKATRAERFTATLSLQNTVISLTKSGNNYVGDVGITTNLSPSAITITANSLTAIGGSMTISNGQIHVSIPANKINQVSSVSVTLQYNNPKTVVDSNAYYYQPSRRLTRSTRQALLGLTLTQSYETKQFTMTVDLPTGDIEIVKKSSLGTQIDGNDCYSVEGAIFSLVKKDDSSKSYTMTTDASGYAKLTGLDSGTYILTETKAPKGHTISNSPKEVVIGGSIVHVDWVDEAANDPIAIVVKKVDADGKTVPQGDASFAGAEFTVKYFDTTTANVTWDSAAERTWTIKTDNDGYSAIRNNYKVSGDAFFTNSNGDVIVPIGTLLIKETKAPTGYNINSTVEKIVITQSGTSSNVVISGNTIQDHELKIDDKVKESYINIIKYTATFGPNGEIAPAEAYANAQLEPGIEFSIKNSSGTTVATKTTGSDGKLTFGPLPYGTYTIVQNTNVEGYETIGSFKVEIDGDNHIKPVGVDDTIIVQDGNTTLKLYNKQKYGTLRVIKVDENGEVIKKAGVKFEIYDTGMHKLTIGGQSEFATNSEGIVDIAGLPYGQYYLVETATVAPFILDSTPQLITINSSTLDNAGMLKFEFENSQAKGRIQIEKKGDVLTSVTTEEQNGVTVYKPVYTNTYLAGAQFQIIANEDIEVNGKIKVHKDEVVETLTTNSTGPVTSGLLHLGSYRLHESVTPVGYITVNDINPIVLVQSDTNPITVHSESIQNTYQQTKFSLRKLAENIVVDPATGNVTITTDYKAGFVFALYVNEDVKYANGNIAISAGSVVAVATSDASGNVVFSGKLPIANYYVKEISAPDDRYILDQTQYPVSNKNQGNTVQVIDIKVVNEPVVNELDKAWAQIVKVNAEDGNVVKMSGFKFDIFDSENNLVDQVETDTNGIAKLRMPLRHGWTYKVVETAVAPGFVLNTTPAYLTIDASSQIAEEDGTTKACYSINFENRPVKGRIEIHKYGKVLTSAEDKVQEGFDVSAPVFENKYLAGAEFEIIAKEDVVINGVKVVTAGDVVARLTTNSTGPVTTDDLYLGSYTIHESKTPDGYITAEDKEITIAERDGLSLIIEKAEITNVLQETEFSLVKHAEFIEVVDETGNVEIVVRKSAGFVFGLYADQDFKSQEGDVVIAKDTRVAAVKSDDEGKVVFAGEYPIGDYYVKEIDYLTDRYLPNDATYPISNKEAGNSVPKIIKPIVNEPIVNELDKAWAQIVKVDAETGEILKIAGFKFDIFDKDGNKVDFVETDNNGVAQLRMPLRHGWTYKVKETAVPEGFVRNTEMFDLVIDDSTLETIDGYAERYTCRFSNTRVKGSISIEKTGLMITDKEIVTEGDFDVTHVVRTVEYLSGAKFRITAREDIVYNGEIKYHAGDEVAVLTTVDGRTKLEEMYLGKYKIEEIEAPAGYVLKPNITEVDLDYAGDDVAIIAKEYSFHNDLRNMTVEMLKHAELMGIVTDSDGNVDVTYSYVEGEGFTFGLFNAFDIVNVNTGDVIVPADTLVEICVSDENGLINFEGKYPVGNYYIKEIATLPKYVLRDDFRFDIDNSCSDPTVEQLDFSLDEPIINNYEYAMVKVTKTDITGGEGLPGATLEVHDEEGNVIYRHVTGEDGGLEEVKLIPGTYTLHEIFAPNGYALSEEIVTFVVNKDGTVEGEATMKDDVTRFSFYKIDEYGRTLSGAEFTMYDENGDVYAVAESDEDGVVTFENMLVGSYIIKETKALPDYQLSSETIELTVTDQWLNSNSYTDGGELMYSIMNYEIIVTGRGLSTGAIIAIVAGSIAIAGLAGLGIVFYKKKKESK